MNAVHHFRCAECLSDSDCLSDQFCFGLTNADPLVFGGLRCLDKRRPGSPCDRDEMCVTGKCDPESGLCLGADAGRKSS